VKKLLLAVMALSLTGCWETGVNEKIGSITKLGRQGRIEACKTWEGEIIRGGMSGGSGSFGASFGFTVEDLTLLPLLKEALNTPGSEVKITYRTEWMTFCRSESQDHFVTAVEFMNKKPVAAASTAAGATTVSTDVIRDIIREELAKMFQAAAKQ